jgi:hypothetical protein
VAIPQGAHQRYQGERVDHFLTMYAVYLKCSPSKVAARVYKQSFGWQRIAVFGSTAGVILGAATALFGAASDSTDSGWFLLFLAFLAFSAVWGWSFDRARAQVYGHLYQDFPAQMKHYWRDYQYVRYRLLLEELGGTLSPAAVDSAVHHIDVELQTRSDSPISNHPFIAICVASTLAIVGAAAGGWSPLVLTSVVVVLLTLVCLGYVVLALRPSTVGRLTEFKRFLLWARDERVVDRLSVEEVSAVNNP